MMNHASGDVIWQTVAEAASQLGSSSCLSAAW
jgi:hypothetical protein